MEILAYEIDSLGGCPKWLFPAISVSGSLLHAKLSPAAEIRQKRRLSNRLKEKVLLCMSILEIVKYPDKFLRLHTKPVEDIDDSIQKLIDNMAETMYLAPGVGLAAIQVGIDKSLIIYDISQKDEKRSLQVIINPRIIETEGNLLSENEGCLSVPDFTANVKRASSVLVEGFDRHGKPLRMEAEGLAAVVLQHEIDHLAGTLFIDRISALKRELYKKRFKKKKRKK